MDNDHIKVSIGKNFMGNLKIHRNLLVIAVVLILLVASAGLLIFKLATNENVIPNVKVATNYTPVSLCTSSQAVNAFLHFNNFSTLNSQTDVNLITNIEKSDSYQQDPNCLFILTRYYVAEGDSIDASKYFTQLKKVYSPNKGLSLVYGGKSFNVNSLSAQISLLQKINQQTQSNATYSGKVQ